MHKSKATSTPTATATTSSTPVEGSKSRDNNTSGNSSADCESIAVIAGGGSSSSKAGVPESDSGTKPNNKDPTSESSLEQSTRPPLDRQGEIGSAPLATFDTVDLSDEEATNNKDGASDSSKVVTSSELSHLSTVHTTSKTTTTTTSTTTTPTNTYTSDAISSEIVLPVSPSICARSPSKVSTGETSSSVGVTVHNKQSSSSVGSRLSNKQSQAATSSNAAAAAAATAAGVVVSDACSRSPDVYQTSVSNSKTWNEPLPSAIPDVNIKSNNKSKKKQKNKNAASKTTPSASPSKEGRQKKKTFFSRKSHTSDVNKGKDAASVPEQCEVVIDHLACPAPPLPYSSDDDGRASGGISPALLLSSPTPLAGACKSDVARSSQESVALAPGVEAGTDGETVNFETPEDGATTPVAPGAKLKDVSTVENVNLIDDSSSSDSELSSSETTENIYPSFGREASSFAIRSNKDVDDVTGRPLDHRADPSTFNSKRKAYERRLQRLQVKTTPINRPRSATPLSVVTLDEYTHLSSPEVSPNLEKLKIVLPPDQFGKPIRSPRSVSNSKENTFDFNEDRLFRHTKEAIVLQSDGSIGQSPRRIFIPPTLSPSQSPCKAAAGSPVSKLVLVSKLPAGTSPLVKSAASTAASDVTPVTASSSDISPVTPTSTTSNTSLLPPPTSATHCPAKSWELFDENTAQLQQSSDRPESQQVNHHTRPDGGDNTQRKGFSAERGNTNNNLQARLDRRHPGLLADDTEEEEEEILKVEIGSSEVGKAYNIELEVSTKDSKLDSLHNKPNC
ncbi:mucin-5AC-like [Argonauta hians]